MKIAIIGAHRVGKTTLAEKLAEALPNYELKMEPYYALEESGFEFSEMPTVDDFMEQLHYSLKQIYTREEKVIFDRCPLDLLAYIHAIDERKNIQWLYQKVQEAVSQLDALIFVPIETPDLILCQKSDLPALRQEVNDILQDWIWGFDVEMVEVHGTWMNRRDQVMSKIFAEM